ncbi:hypothetical protein [Gimesia alba]|uniref:hypothetical protein n=1 Tax=Gimesia alba TaxID=2527973 RepID=UPI00119E0A5A|nr:hypothetical protein [Gimesia alba]
MNNAEKPSQAAAQAVIVNPQKFGISEQLTGESDTIMLFLDIDRQTFPECEGMVLLLKYQESRLHDVPFLS